MYSATPLNTLKNIVNDIDFFIVSSAVEPTIPDVKKALETNNTETIKEATEKLTQVFYQISEQLYKQNAAANGAGATEETAQGPQEGEDGNVFKKIFYDTASK